MYPLFLAPTTPSPLLPSAGRIRITELPDGPKSKGLKSKDLAVEIGLLHRYTRLRRFPADPKNRWMETYLFSPMHFASIEMVFFDWLISTFIPRGRQVMLSHHSNRSRLTQMIASFLMAALLAMLPGFAFAAQIIPEPPASPAINVPFGLPKYPGWEFKIYMATDYINRIGADFGNDGVREPEDGLPVGWFSPAFYWRDVSVARDVARELIARGINGWVRYQDGVEVKEKALSYHYKGLYESGFHFVDWGTVLVPFQHNEEVFGVNLARVGFVVGLLSSGNTPDFGLDLDGFKTYDGKVADATILLARPLFNWGVPNLPPPVGINPGGAIGVANVPEPTAFSIWGIGALVIFSKRSRFTLLSKS